MKVYFCDMCGKEMDIWKVKIITEWYDKSGGLLAEVCDKCIRRISQLLIFKK